jgi:hypothetical protein
MTTSTAERVKPICRCGEVATIFVRDMREVEPTPGPGGPYEAWEPVDPPRMGCFEHPPEPSKRFYRDGRVLTLAPLRE